MKPTTTVRTTRPVIACVSALALTFAACGGGSSDISARSTDAADTSASQTDPSAPPPADIAPPATQPPTTEPAPAQDVAMTTEGVRGYWVNTAGFSSLFVDFRADGTFTIGGSGRLRNGAFTNGTFEAIDATTISFRTADDASECPGVTMTWTGTANDHGVMAIDALAPDCEVPDPTRWGWTRVSPASTASLTLAVGNLDVAPLTATEISEVTGLWLRVGTGGVLAMDPAGTYLLTSDGNSLEPLDSGSYVIDAPGALTFTSDGSGACAAGETWTWTEVTTAKDLLRENQARGFSMRSDSSELCGSVDVHGSWRLLSPEKS